MKIYNFYKNVILLFVNSTHQLKWIVFHLSLSDRMSPQISKALLRILNGFSSTVVWMVSILHLICWLPGFYSRFLDLFQGTQLQLASSSPCFGGYIASSCIVWSVETVKSSKRNVLFPFFFFLYHRLPFLCKEILFRWDIICPYG